MNKTIVNILIITLFLIGILGVGNLVLKEISTSDGCPKFGAVPACYIILICFVVPFTVHLIGKWNVIYFLGTGTAFLIAIVASVMQFSGNAECPKVNGNLPTCYFSFLICLGLIILKVIYLKNKNNEQ